MTLTRQKVNSAQPWSATKVHGHTSDLIESVQLAVTPEHEKQHQYAYGRKHEYTDGTKLRANTDGSAQ